MSPSRKRVRTWAIGGVALVAAAGLLAWAFAPRPVPVEAAAASRGRFELAIEEDGKTRVRDRYTISAPLAGRLSRIALREGDVIARGAVVATLTPTLSPMLDARTEQQLSARADTAEAVIARSAARIERARVALAQARHVLKRDEALAREKFVSASQIDSDRLAVAAAEKELDGANEERHVAEHELDQARSALAAVRGEDGTAFEVRAPVAGRVLRLIQPSATVVAMGAPLIEIGDVGAIEIVAELLTADALRAKPGTPVRIERWGGPEALEGRVRRVEPSGFTKVSALGVEEQRVNVLIDILSPPERWRALGDGYRVGVRIIALAEDDVLRVPVGAVFPRAGGADDRKMAVFAIEDGRARLKPVEVGARNGEQAWIVSGLDAGARVIVYPGDAVRDGVRVVERTIDVAGAAMR